MIPTLAQAHVIGHHLPSTVTHQHHWMRPYYRHVQGRCPGAFHWAGACRQPLTAGVPWRRVHQAAGQNGGETAATMLPAHLHHPRGLLRQCLQRRHHWHQVVCLPPAARGLWRTSRLVSIPTPSATTPTPRATAQACNHHTAHMSCDFAGHCTATTQPQQRTTRLSRRHAQRHALLELEPVQYCRFGYG